MNPDHDLLIKNTDALWCLALLRSLPIEQTNEVLKVYLELTEKRPAILKQLQRLPDPS